MSIWDPKETLESIGLGKQGPKRSERVAEAIRHELSMALLRKVRDPKLADVTFSKVEVSDDLKIARVFFSMFDGPQRAKTVEQALIKAKGFMRSHLANTLNMRYTPALQFRYDKTADKVAEMDLIFQEIADERKRRGTEDS
ncbi:ribosome-binding factor A [candidate division KSB3 bacterium]|uniref:Ribosome-binding factor A n=1 Tax=candidate division KSB3 bacterium TaxID=2044937 RepID=A0A2G6EBE2_9BACT|nr:MAG: ribosome-binding factor A [candidate division KSB3 bacterium]